jgi:hypothetical protein
LHNLAAQHGEAPAAGRPVRRFAPSERPTLLLALPYAINVRDILRTAVFRTLKEAGVRIVLVSPAHDRPEFREEFGGENIHFEPLHPYEPQGLEAKLDTLRYTLFHDLTATINVRAVAPGGRSAWKRTALQGARLVCRKIGQRRTEQALAWVSATLFPDESYLSLLERYRPDLVCLTRTFGMSPDQPVLKSAVRLGYPTMLLVSSWDNLTGKGIFFARPDRLVVWNPTMAEEAMHLHGYRADQILVAGVPQFDIYADKSQLPDRQAFFRRVGADPSKALITFALTNVRTCPDEFDTLEMIWKRMSEGALGKPCQLLARVHPQAGAFGEMFPERLRGLPGLLVDIPGRPGVHSDRDASLEDMKHLAATMWHSDVVINTSSTIAIDAAAMDTPVVCAGFDGHRDLPLEKSVRRYHEYTHFKKLLSLGGVRVAHSLDQIVDHLNAYLADPTLDREGRARIVERQCRSIDGKAGERMAEHILAALREKRGARQP